MVIWFSVPWRGLAAPPSPGGPRRNRKGDKTSWCKSTRVCTPRAAKSAAMSGIRGENRAAAHEHERTHTSASLLYKPRFLKMHSQRRNNTFAVDSDIVSSPGATQHRRAPGHRPLQGHRTSEASTGLLFPRRSRHGISAPGHTLLSQKETS